MIDPVPRAVIEPRNARVTAHVEEVDVVHGLPRLGVDFETDERAVVTDVVDQYVDVAVLAEYVAGQAGDVSGIGDIDHVSPGRGSDFACGLQGSPGTFGVDVDNLHRRTVPGEQEADRGPDAAAATGHDGDLPVEKSVPSVDGRDIGRSLGTHGRLSSAGLGTIVVQPQEAYRGRGRNPEDDRISAEEGEHQENPGPSGT